MTHHRTLGWNPERTWVFVVGTLEWKHSEYFDPFPQENRRDAALVEFFRAQGVPSAQIAYLQDRQATTKRIQQAFEAHLAAAGAGDLLVLYYCGHGGKADDGAAYFASYDTDCDANQGWVVDTIPATIERCFTGSRALLLADCCYSGTLADAVTRLDGTVSYACLTSSLASELSTGNWTYTEGLLAGLRGQALVDADGDSTITLRELAAQIAESMAFAEEQIATFATVGDFDPDMVIASARPRLGPRVGQRAEVHADDSWYPAQIIDARGEELKVHYYGYEESDDEWVTADRIREAKRKSYPIGAAVEVKWKRSWYPAKVLEVLAGIHHIQYQDYGPEWNEWVASKRIRRMT
ncbi:MAG: agenet domain-containing protein [Roseiflexaceae bacterium]